MSDILYLAIIAVIVAAFLWWVYARRGPPPDSPSRPLFRASQRHLLIPPPTPLAGPGEEPGRLFFMPTTAPGPAHAGWKTASRKAAPRVKVTTTAANHEATFMATKSLRQVQTRCFVTGMNKDACMCQACKRRRNANGN